MILHTILPVERVLMAELPKPPATVQIAGGLLEGRETPKGFVIDRLIATDPRLYLDPALAPGAIYLDPAHPADPRG